MMRNAEILTTGEIATVCGCSPRTVQKWCDSGDLPNYHIPGSQDRRVVRRDFIRFLREHDMPLGRFERRHTVLLIGTDVQLVDRLRELLPANVGFLVQTADTAFVAGQMVAEFGPGVVVMDLALGRSDGCRIAAQLRQDRLYDRTLLVALANEDETEPDLLTAQGFDEIFKKPFEAALLAAYIGTNGRAG